MQLKDAIEKYFTDNEEAMIETLARLVAINSERMPEAPGLPFGEGPAAALAEALKISGELGFVTKNYDNYVATVSFSGEPPFLDILAHLDIVPAGDGWDTPPFELRRKEGLLYGRGVDDNKGPAVAVLYAMKAVSDLGIKLRRNVRLILGTNEETGSADLEYFFKSNNHAPHSFTPDAEFPVINIEKGQFRGRLRASFTDKSPLVAVKSAKGGTAFNVVPAEAHALVSGLSFEELKDSLKLPVDCSFELSAGAEGIGISVKGLSAHASKPELGVNANTALLQALAGLPLGESQSGLMTKRLNSLFPHGDNRGEALGIAQSDELSGELSLSLTLLDIDEKGMDCVFDSRTPLSANEENCYAAAKSRLEEAGIELEAEISPPHHTPEDSDFVKTLLKCYEQYSGEKGYCLAIGGGTYVHNIEGGVAFGAGMPGFDSGLHSANERIAVKNWLLAARIFTQVIIDLCG